MRTRTLTAALLGETGERPGLIAMARRAVASLVALAGLLIAGQPVSAEPLDRRTSAIAGGADAEVFAAWPITWTELGPSGLIARAITTEATCPEVRFDWHVQPMQVRAEPAPPAFPVLVCEAAVPPSTHLAWIGGRRIPLFRPNPRRIVVIGDAGCRIEGSKIQACNDPSQWPFAAIARRAAAWRPDLVIHVGDYIYREDPCPPGNEGCAGSPYGHNWAALQADLFTPASPLLRAAPWVFVRGNHETCARGGEGWFRFLYPLPPPPGCVDYTDPYRISLGHQDLLILDLAITDDSAVPPEQVAAFKAQFETLRRRESWLVTHKPALRLRPRRLPQRRGAALHRSGGLAGRLRERLSRSDPPVPGRAHPPLRELSFGRARPPQMVVGNSGTELAPAVETPLAGLEIAGLEVASGLNVDRFGFVTMQRVLGVWTATLRGVRGVPLVGCGLGARGLTCRRTPFGSADESEGDD